MSETVSKDWFYQIKASGDVYGKLEWTWPPVLTGKVTAATKKEAKAAIDQEFDQEFPQRVLRKDIREGGFLLRIEEIKTDRQRQLFSPRECRACNETFAIIDSYNDIYQKYKGPEYCSDECKEIARNQEQNEFIKNSTKFPPVIYKITNVKTCMCYIGKTTQAFTLRWWQHFSAKTNTKFSKAINLTSLKDWNFSIIEVIDERDAESQGLSLETWIAEREQHHIKHNNSIELGYNSVIASKEKQQGGAG